MKKRRLYFSFALAAAAAIASLIAVRWLAPRPPLCARAAEIFCSKLESCGGLAGAQGPACVARHAAACELDLGWRLRKGALLLHREAEDECVEGLEEARCGAVASVLGDDDQDILELTDRCELEELHPGSGLGGPCALPGDCIAGTCPYAAPGCHVCKAYARPGQPCSMGGDSCEPSSAYCDLQQDGGRCALRKASGAACQDAGECSSGVCRAAGGGRQCADDDSGICADNRDCAAHDFCRSTSQGNRCAPRAAVGAPCENNGSDSVCLDGEARCVRGRCRVRPFSEPEGAACAELTDCESGLYCRAPDRAGGAGRCVRQALAGEACRATDFASCALSARCVGDRCKPLAAQGEPCGGPYECLAELECIPRDAAQGFASGAVCLAPAGAGEACGPYRSCLGGFCSHRGPQPLCVPKAPAGAPCLSREECLSGRCQPAIPGGPASCQGPCG